MNTRIEEEMPNEQFMGNPLDIEFEDMNGEHTTLRALGDSNNEQWIVVNVASACGFTKQYTQLQEASVLDGITVVGFPCNQFGAQEPGTHQEICDFTSATIRGYLSINVENRSKRRESTSTFHRTESIDRFR